MKLRTILFASLVILSSSTTTKKEEFTSITHELLYEQITEKNIKFPEEVFDREVSESITHELLYEQIIEKNIKFPEVVFAQAVLESGHFKAPIFTTKNNLFGMRVPKKRETTAINKGKKGYAKYHSWDSSVEDYLLWQQFTLKNKSQLTKSQYLSLLGRIYAKDKDYVLTLKKVMSKYKNRVY
jgi:uncharacterized FlgJ-related protein